MGVRYMICHWAINRTDPQNSLSMTLDVPLYLLPLGFVERSGDEGDRGQCVY